MNTTRKPKSRLGRKLAKIASEYRKLEIESDSALRSVKRSVRILDRMQEDYPK